MADEITTTPAATVADTFVFDTGVRIYEVNGYALKFNPTDDAFVCRYNGMLKRLGAKQDELGTAMKQANEDGDGDKMLAILDEYRAVAIESFDALLGDGASDSVFGGCSPLAVQPDTRLPLWVIVCDYLGSVIMQAIDELPEEAKTDKLRIDGAKSRALVQKYKIKARTGK